MIYLFINIYINKSNYGKLLKNIENILKNELRIFYANQDIVFKTMKYMMVWEIDFNFILWNL